MSHGETARATELYNASNAAARAGDIEAANRHWKDLVYLLWKPMERTTPWHKKDHATPPRDSVTASRSRESTTSIEAETVEAGGCAPAVTAPK